MELRELKSFCAAARARSLTRAAGLLGIGQPAVSKHVKSLEKEIGHLLFDKASRPIRLTPAGVRLLEYVEPIIRDLDELTIRTEVEPAERLRVAATSIFIQQILPAVAKECMSHYDKTLLRIVSATTTGEVMDIVQDGGADLGIVAQLEHRPGLYCEALSEFHRVLITPLNHPLLVSGVTSLEQIARWPLVLTLAGGSGTRDLLEHEFERQQIAYDAVVEVNNFSAIKEYVSLGLGISIVPSLVIRKEDMGVLGLVDLRPFLPTERLGYVASPNRSGVLVQQFISALKDSIPKIIYPLPANLTSR